MHLFTNNVNSQSLNFHISPQKYHRFLENSQRLGTKCRISMNRIDIVKLRVQYLTILKLYVLKSTKNTLGVFPY